MIFANPQLRIILMSATIDTTLFSQYFGDCPIIELQGRTFPVQQYFLEDTVQMLDFVPPLAKKRKNNNNNDDDEEDGEDDRADGKFQFSNLTLTCTQSSIYRLKL